MDTSKASGKIHMQSFHDEDFVLKDTLQPSHQQVERFIKRLRQHQITPGQCLVMMESTGLLHLNFAEALTVCGFCVLAVNPLLTNRRHTVENAIRDHKTDPIDAHGLCQCGLEDAAKLMHFRYESDAQRFGFQRLCTLYDATRKACINLTKAAEDLLNVVFPEAASIKLSMTHLGFCSLLKNHQTPQQIAALSTEQLRAYVGEKATKIKQKAARSFVHPAIAEVSAPVLVKYIEQIEQLRQSMEQLTQQMNLEAKKVADPQWQKLALSITGFGERTVPIILAHLPKSILVSGSKRKISRKLQAFFGFEPRLKTSGKWVGNIKVSKRGNKLVRTAFYQVADMSRLHDPHMQEYYYKLKSEGKHHKEAVVCMMRKCLQRLVSILVDQTPFIPTASYETL